MAAARLGLTSISGTHVRPSGNSDELRIYAVPDTQRRGGSSRDPAYDGTVGRLNARTCLHPPATFRIVPLTTEGALPAGLDWDMWARALAHALRRPILLALADAINHRQKDYYIALQQASLAHEITPWLTWFANTVDEAQSSTQARAEFLIEKTRLLDRLEIYASTGWRSPPSERFRGASPALRLSRVYSLVLFGLLES